MDSNRPQFHNCYHLCFFIFKIAKESRFTMHRTLLHTLAAIPALAWTQPRFGYVPGNNYGVPQNASYDYVVVGGGNVDFTYLRVVTLF
jgi:hypothetical protein